MSWRKERAGVTTSKYSPSTGHISTFLCHRSIYPKKVLSLSDSNFASNNPSNILLVRCIENLRRLIKNRFASKCLKHLINIF